MLALSRCCGPGLLLVALILQGYLARTNLFIAPSHKFDGHVEMALVGVLVHLLEFLLDGFEALEHLGEAGLGHGILLLEFSVLLVRRELHLPHLRGDEGTHPVIDALVEPKLRAVAAVRATFAIYPVAALRGDLASHHILLSERFLGLIIVATTRCQCKTYCAQNAQHDD